MMLILSGIIAKIMLMVEGVLENWVTIEVGGATSGTLGAANCYQYPTLTATNATCFNPFVTAVGDIVEGVVDLVPALLAGAFALDGR